MQSSSASNKRIAINTILLYVRMIVVLLINLYTVRVVLRALGYEDYGIYNVVAGIITVLASFSSVLSTATQRFLSYSLGNQDYDKLKQVFSASINVFFTISLVALLFGETIGLWFVNNELVIPNNRIVAANWIYQFSMVSFVASMLGTPYLAASIAHEDMGLFSIVTTIDAILKLCFAFLISYVPFDDLIFYGAYLLLIQVFTFLCYFLICRNRYVECRYAVTCDWKLHKEILSFSGWTLFSSLAVIGVNQGVAILINIFFGPIVNAALAISVQVNSALSTFCNSFIMAVRPPMIKAYAEERYDYLKRMFSISNKFTYYCMLIVAIPLIFEMSKILHLWLGEISDQTVLFCQLGVVYSVILSLCNPIAIIVQATGKMKQFTVPVEMVTISTPIVVYVLFKLGLAAECAFYAMIVIVIAAQIVRLIYLKKVFPLVSLRHYIVSFVVPAFVVTLISVPVCFIVHILCLTDVVRLLCVTVSSVLTVVITTLIFGLNKSEKMLVKSLLTKSK